jgi:hypothetical protein
LVQRKAVNGKEVARKPVGTQGIQIANAMIVAKYIYLPPYMEGFIFFCGGLRTIWLHAGRVSQLCMPLKKQKSANRPNYLRYIVATSI